MVSSSESENDILLSALSAFVQDKSESTSEAIKWGLRQGFRTGKSKMYSRKFFSYKHNEDGKLIIDEEYS
jgi:site-specific DNA recombinase